MLKVRRVQIAALFVCLLASAACIHNSSTSPKQTALQATIVGNAAVVKANNAVEKAVEDAVTGKVLTATQARPVVTACLKIAQTSESIRAITSNGTEASWSIDGPKIRAILASTPLKVSASVNATIDPLIAALNSTIDFLITGVK